MIEVEKVTKAELNKCKTIEEKMEWLEKVLGYAIFKGDMNYAVWVNVQKNNIIESIEKENAELKKDKEYLDNINNEQTEIILKLNEQIEQLSNDNHVLKTAFITQQEQIEKMKNDQKTAFIKGMRHFAKALKKYDQTEGAWTDYFENTVDTVLNRELAE